MSKPAFLDDLDFGSAFADAATDALKDLAAEQAKALASEYLTDVFVGVAGAAAQTLVGGLAGPLLKSLLRASDKTSQKLDLLISEPFTTGIRAAQAALETTPISVADRRFRRNEFELATEKLESAYTFASGKTAPGARFYIRLLQGLIARESGAIAYARRCFQECLQRFELADRQRMGSYRDHAFNATRNLARLRDRDAEYMESAISAWRWWVEEFENPEKYEGNDLHGSPYSWFEWDDLEAALTEEQDESRQWLARQDPLLLFLEAECEVPDARTMETLPPSLGAVIGRRQGARGDISRQGPPSLLR
ncbi:MAG: hypothetical protein WCC70_08790 [Candidatus Aquilonibacter sp.]